MRTYTLAFLFVIASTRLMAADLDARIVNLDGGPLLDDKGKETTLTVRSIAVNSLMAPYPDEQNLSGEDKMKRVDLARRLQDTKTKAELTSEDIVLIKRLVNKAYASPLVVEQTWKALERK